MAMDANWSEIEIMTPGKCCLFQLDKLIMSQILLQWLSPKDYYRLRMSVGKVDRLILYRLQPLYARATVNFVQKVEEALLLMKIWPTVNSSTGVSLPTIALEKRLLQLLNDFGRLSWNCYILALQKYYKLHSFMGMTVDCSPNDGSIFISKFIAKLKDVPLHSDNRWTYQAWDSFRSANDTPFDHELNKAHVDFFNIPNTL